MSEELSKVIAASALQKMLDDRRTWLASCERTIELLTPEWELFEAREGKHDTYVTRLVIAARIVAFEDQGVAAIRELDQASEAFASRVCWDDEGGDLPEAHANPCTCGASPTPPATERKEDGA